MGKNSGSGPGEGHDKICTLLARLTKDVPALTAQHFPAEMQSQPHSPTITPRCPFLSKHFLPMFRGEGLPAVLHPETEIAGILIHFDTNGAAVTRVVDGVAQQLAENAFQGYPVPPDNLFRRRQ